MKLNKNRGIVAIAGLLGFGALAFAAPANAQSSSRADAIKDVRRAEAQLQRERRDLYRARTPHERQDALKDIRNAQEHLQRERRDLNRFGGYPSYNYNYGQYRRYNNYGQYRRNNNPGAYRRYNNYGNYRRPTRNWR